MAGGTIVIEESDEEELRILEAQLIPKKRRREAPVAGRNVDISFDDDDVEVASGSGKKHIKTGEKDASSGRKAKRPRLSRSVGEVIVVDD